MDTASLTGEPLPMAVEPGAELAAGCLNLAAPLELEVLRRGGESAIARIVHLVEQAQLRKAPIQGLADRVAGRFTLVVLLLALATFLFWWLWGAHHWPSVLMAGAPHGHPGHGHGAPGPAGTPFALALQLAIAVLVVACPCALGLATPAAISVGSGAAARGGLLFRGGDAIETASRLAAVLFDKTGTLTLGRPLVTALAWVAPVSWRRTAPLGRESPGKAAPGRALSSSQRPAHPGPFQPLHQGHRGRWKPPRPIACCSWRPVLSVTVATPGARGAPGSPAARPGPAAGSERPFLRRRWVGGASRATCGAGGRSG